MATMRQTGSPSQYKVLDRDCIGRACFAAGLYEHRGATGSSGSRSTGRRTACCLTRAYHGCPRQRAVDNEIAKARRAEGWRIQGD